MAMGLGQFAGEFASPDYAGAGVATWDQVSGIQDGSPFVTGPASGGFGAPADGTGLVHLGGDGAAPEGAGGMSHWSEMLNWQHSPLPWLLLLALGYFGLIHLSVAGRVGRR
jgi:hypothetical protein